MHGKGKNGTNNNTNNSNTWAASHIMLIKIPGNGMIMVEM